MKLSWVSQVARLVIGRFSIFNVINLKEFASLPETIQQQLNSCEELLLANENIDYRIYSVWGAQEVKQISLLLEHVEKLVVECVKNPDATVGRPPYLPCSWRSMEGYPLAKVIMYLLELERIQIGTLSEWIPALNNVSLASPQATYSFKIVRSQFLFLRESFLRVISRHLKPQPMESYGNPELEHFVLFHQVAVSGLVEQLSSVVPVAGCEALFKDDYLNVIDYLGRAIESIEELFLGMELQVKRLAEKAYEDLVDEDIVEARSIERFVAFERKGIKYLPPDARPQSDYLKQVFVLAKSSPQVQTIAELISRLKAMLQLKALETRLYLARAVHVSYPEQHELYHPGTTKRSVLRLLGKLDELGFECLDDLPEQVKRFTDYASFFKNGKTASLLREIREHAETIIPLVINLKKWAIISFKVDLSKQVLEQVVARLTEITPIMINALNAIYSTLQAAFETFRAADFDRFVTRLFEEIPFNGLVSAVIALIDAVKDKTGLSCAAEFNFSARLARVVPFAPLDYPVYPGPLAPSEAELPV